ncbi:MAG: hypothetical protein M3P96_08515 [Actinomycetota bacterium]|nr:hypothetical protein [Actinomycetota bacterium]
MSTLPAPRRSGPQRHYGWVVVAVTAAALLVAAGVRSAPGVLLPAWEADFGWSRAEVSLAASLGLLLLTTPASCSPAIFAVLFGLDYIATVPPTTALVADAFGRRSVGTVFGWVFCAHQVGAAAAAYGGGWARGVFGDYTLAFLSAAALCVVAAAMARGVPGQRPVDEPTRAPAPV